MRVAVCDDCVKFIDSFSRLLNQCLGEGDVLYRFRSGYELLGSFDEAYPYDLTFLDIEMPGMTGLEVAEAIRKISDDSFIVIFTSHRKYALGSIQYQLTDYLLKPVTEAKLHSILQKIRKKLQRTQYFTVHTKYDLHRIPLSQIFYIDVLDHRLFVHTKDRVYEYFGNIGKVEAELSGHGFFLVHRSVLVNLDRIQKINRTGGTVLLEDSSSHPVSRERIKPLISACMGRDLL